MPSNIKHIQNIKYENFKKNSNNNNNNIFYLGALHPEWYYKVL